MLIIDTRKSVPLDVSRLDWSEEKTKWLDKNTLSIPLHDPAFDETVKLFAYEIASLQPWLFPDLNTSTVEFKIDFWYSFPRYYLRIGTKPNESFHDDGNAECAEFNARRKQAIKENAGNPAYDDFQVMLTPAEEDNIRCTLHKLDVY